MSGYEEKIIDGVLHYTNGHPFAWHEFTREELTDKFVSECSKYGRMTVENSELRELIRLIFESTVPYNEKGECVFSDEVLDRWRRLSPE